MFKKILALFLFACLLLSAAGCGNEQQSAEESGSSRETADVTNGDDSRNPTEGTASSPSEQEDATSTAEDETASAPVQEPARPEAQISASTIPADSQAKSTQAPPSAPSAKDTESEQPAEVPPIPDAQEPPVKEEPDTIPEEPTQSESTQQPEFDVEYWVSFAKSYAEDIGLELDSSAIWCWDTPIVAGSHCLYLERDITDRLTRYKEGGDIGRVWIWAEPRGDGSYDLYVGYA